MIKWFNLAQPETWLSGDKTYVAGTDAIKRIIGDVPNAGFIYWGGADIASILYKEKPVMQQTPYQKTLRDTWEVAAFDVIRNADRPMIGICRGAQLLNVLCGGKLWQDVDNHAGNVEHDIHVCYKGTTYQVNTKLVGNSEHHQMAIVAPEVELYGWTEGVATRLINEKGTFASTSREPEIFGYPNKRVLCIQGHPEWMIDSEYDHTCKSIIEDFFA